MKRILVHISLLCVILAACSKEAGHTDQYVDNHRFFLKGEVNGEPFDIKAGEDDYFLETSYSRDNGIVIMEGTLARTTEPNRNAFSIKIRGAEVSSSQTQFLVDENIVEKNYAFRDKSGFNSQPEKYEISFFGDTTLANLEYTWTFPDGSYSNDQSPTRTVDINSYVDFPVSMQTSQNGGCQSLVTHYVNLADDCDGTFRMEIPSTGSMYKTEVKTWAGDIDRAEWFLDGNQVYPNFFNEIDINQVPGASVLSCDILFKDGCTKRIERDLSVTNYNPCVTDMWYSKNKPVIFNPNQYSTIEIEYYDSAGELYSSYYSNVEGEFKIVSTSPFQQNENGQSTIRFFMELDVMLKNDQGETLSLKNVFGTLAVAHP